MSLKVLVKAESGVTPSVFTLDLQALVNASAPQYDHAGPFWGSFSWEVHTPDTTAAGGAFQMRMNWQSPSGQTRILESTMFTVADPAIHQVLGPVFIQRSGPGTLWTFEGLVSGSVGNATVNWNLAIMPITSPDVIAI